MKVYKVHLRKQKRHLRNNIRPCILICYNTKNPYLRETKRKLAFDMNGMLCKDGVPNIGRIFLGQESYIGKSGKLWMLAWFPLMS